MGIRDQFKASSMESIKEQEDDQKAKSPNQNKRTDVLEIVKDGSKNRLRIYPKHPGTKTFMKPLVVTFMKVEAVDKNGDPELDGNGKNKMVYKPIFDAIVHGEWIDRPPVDILRLYVEYAKKKAEFIKDKDTWKKYLEPVFGSPFGKDNKPGKFKGIKAQESYMLYGKLNGKFGRVQLKTLVKNRINELAAGQDAKEGVIITDPYTGPDDGRVVFITYKKGETDKTKLYEVSVDLSGPTPLTEADLDELAAQKSLDSLYTNVYKLRDFDLALEGLQRFDEESEAILKELGFDEGYRVFENEEFKGIVGELIEYWESMEKPDTESEESEEEPSTTPEPTQNKATTQAPPFKTDSSTTGDKFDQMDFDQLKKEATGLGLKVGKSFTEAILREAIRDELAELETTQSEFAGRAEGLDVAAELAKPIEETPPVQQEKAATPAGASRLDRFKSK